MKKKLALLTAVILVLALVFPGCSQTDTAGKTGSDTPPETLDSQSFIEWFGTGNKLRNAEETEHTFRLTENIVLTQDIRLDGRSVTLNLDGHSITGGAFRAFTLSGGATLTLIGGTIATKGEDSDGGVFRLDSSNLTLDNMIVQNTDDSHISERRIGGVIYANSESENFGIITLKGGIFREQGADPRLVVHDQKFHYSSVGF